jgi:glucokinase
MSDGLAVGVDLGATKIATALVTWQGQVLASRHVPTEPSEGSEAVISRIVAEVRALISQSPGAVVGVGIGAPGNIDRAGVVRGAVNLGWDGISLADGVRSRLNGNLAVWVQKDTNAGALGEYLFGAGQGCRDLAYLTVGSGLGGGVIANGELVLGEDRHAADLGHLSLDPAGYPCTCGARGCAETIVSGPGLLRLTREYLAQRQYSTRLIDSPDLTTGTILSAAHLGDQLALAALDQVARWLGIVMSVCVSVLNPARIVLGGGLGLAASEWLLPAARQELERRVIIYSRQNLQIVLSQVTSSAVGAASLVFYSQRPTHV